MTDPASPPVAPTTSSAVADGGVAGIDPALWTTVIPAAGRGSRLNFDRPKILFPVAGRPILEWLIEELSGLCGRFVFVLSPAGTPCVRPELERLLPGQYEIVLQHDPLGMGHAVMQAEPAARTPATLVLWGDQVGISRATISDCMRLHQADPVALATLPTVQRSRPYIHFERQPGGRLQRILQAREGDPMPPEGESDCGLFAFSTRALFETLRQLAPGGELRGASTGELNLLPLLPFLDRPPGRLRTFPLARVEETVGINTASDSLAVAAMLTLRLNTRGSSSPAGAPLAQAPLAQPIP